MERIYSKPAKKLSLNTKNILRWIRATSSPFLNFLFSVASQVTWPPCKIKCHTVRNSSRGKLQTIPPRFTTETAYLSWLFPVSGRIERHSPNSGVPHRFINVVSMHNTDDGERFFSLGSHHSHLQYNIRTLSKSVRNGVQKSRY